MKQKLTLLLIALFTTVGAWAADTLPASTWNISSELPTDNWVAMDQNTPAGVSALGSYTAFYRTQEVTLETAGMVYINFLYSSGNHRLDILGVDALNSSSEVVASDYHVGYTGGNKSLNDYFLNGLSAGTYTLRYIIHNGNTTSSVGNITLRKYEADVVASLPQLTTDENNPKYYSIGSYNRGGYLTSNGAGQGMTHVDFAAGSSWYFTPINGNNSGTVIGGVIAHCSDGTQMKQNWQTAATGQTVYILPNGVNTNGLSISKTLPISSSSCCDASNVNTGVGNWSPSSSDWEGTTWVIEPTVPIGPTGYYYFKGMATDRHPYLYSDFVTKSSVATYHHDLPGTPNNGHVWKVTNEGTTFTLSNGEGLVLTTTDGQQSSTNTPHSTLTLSAASAGPDYFFTEAINLTNWGNDERLVTWTDGGSSPSDNRWTFELVDVSAGVYNVVVQGNNDGYVTYSDQNAKNGGFFVASSIAVGDLTAKAIDGYTTSISISDRTITVSYNQLLTYTLTDANGATYEGTYNGPVGVTPTFTGCSGYTLTDGSWSGTAYSATINFPFAISSNDIDNYTFIGQFNNKSGYSAPEFLWHAKTVSETPSIIIHSGDLPTTDDDDHDKYLWSIIPAFSNGAFTFTIKNKSTGTYVNSTYTENRHNVGDVTLSETATPMTYNSATPTGTCSPINAWYLPSTSKYLSANSVSNGANAVLGVWGSVHDGISTGFPTYGDLISIYWSSNEIASKIAKAGQLGYPAANNEYATALAGVMTAYNGGTYTGNKTNYNNLRTWYEGYKAAAVITPTTGFYRIRSILGANAYLKSVEPGTRMTVTTTADKETIFCLDAESHLVSYTKGVAINNVRELGNVGVTGNTFAFVKALSGNLGQFSIKCNDGSSYNNNYLYSTGVDGSSADRNTLSSSFYNQNSFTVEPVESLPVTISAAGYATLYSPVALTIPTGVTAYVATNNTTYLSLTAIDGGIIPANTGVILAGSAGTYDFEITTGGSADSNALSGTVAAIARPSGSYILATGDSGIGFYGDGASTIPGFKAYLPEGAGVKGFIGFEFDDATGLNSFTPALFEGEGAIFNVAGQRLNKIQKGINIVNGKKVMVK